MKTLLLPAVLALLPMGARAEPPPSNPANPAARADDPRAAVPETRYRAPQAYRRPEHAASTPDRHWVEANRTVLDYNPMMLTMPERAPAGKQEAPSAPRHEHGDGHGHGHGQGARHAAEHR